MSVGILNVRSQSSYTNELEFEWDTQVEGQVYIKVNIVLESYRNVDVYVCIDQSTFVKLNRQDIHKAIFPTACLKTYRHLSTNVGWVNRSFSTQS